MNVRMTVPVMQQAIVGLKRTILRTNSIAHLTGMRLHFTRDASRSDDVANYCLPKTWPEDREQRARLIGEWLQTEARYLA